LGGPSQVLSYLGRYTHRVAISNDRLVEVTEEQVSFRWKDYRHGNQITVMTLEASEFMRRFLLHVLPRGFQRLRHYGYLSNRQRAEKLERCRRLLGVGRARDEELAPAATAPEEAVDGERLAPCPECHRGRMRRIEVVAATAAAAASRRPLVPRWQKVDSS
jgi:putative transposase